MRCPSAFTLSYLYHEFSAGGKITLEQYQAVGGVTRSIDMALKRAFGEPTIRPEYLRQKRTSSRNCARLLFHGSPASIRKAACRCGAWLS